MSKYPHRALLAFLVVPIAICGCGLWLDDEARIGRARAALESSQHSAAIIDLKAVLQRSPDNGTARKLLGLALMANGEREAAEKELQRALELGEPVDEFRVALGEALLATGQPQQALQVADPGAAADIEEAFALWLLRGDAQAELGEPANALRSYQEGGSLDIDPAEALLRAAELYWGAGNSNDARSFAEAALAVDPGDVDGHLTLAAILLAVDDPKASADTCADAMAELQLDPEDRGYLVACLAEAQLAQANVEAATQALEELRTLWPADDPDLQLLSGQVALAQGNNEVAVAELQTYLIDFPDSARAARMLGAARLARGELYLAKSPLISALRADPDDVETRTLLARLYLAQGKADSARTALQSALILAPEDPTLLSLLGLVDLSVAVDERSRLPVVAEQLLSGQVTQALASAAAGAIDEDPEALNLLGLTQLANGQRASSVATFSKAVAAKPESPAYRLNLARGYLANGTPEAGLTALSDLSAEEADVTRRGLLISQHEATNDVDPNPELLDGWLTTHPNDIDARARLAETYIDIGAFSAAAAEYELLLEKGLDDPGAYNNLAWVYLQLDDERARGQAEYAVYVDPGNGAFADTLGWILVLEGDVEPGLAVLRDAHLLRPGDPEITYHLAYALTENGEQDEARTVLNGLLDGATGPLEESVAELLATLEES